MQNMNLHYFSNVASLYQHVCSWSCYWQKWSEASELVWAGSPDCTVSCTHCSTFLRSPPNTPSQFPGLFKLQNFQFFPLTCSCPCYPVSCWRAETAGSATTLPHPSIHLQTFFSLLLISPPYATLQSLKTINKCKNKKKCPPSKPTSGDKLDPVRQAAQKKAARQTESRGNEKTTGEKRINSTNCNNNEMRKEVAELKRSNHFQTKESKEEKKPFECPHHACWWAGSGILCRTSWHREEEQDSDWCWSSGRCFLLLASYLSRWMKARHCCSCLVQRAPSGCRWWMLWM